MTPLEISLKILPALIAILSFLLVIYVGKTYHPMAALHRTYIRIDGILVTVGLCIIALLLCVVMKDSLTSFIQAIVTAMQNKAIGILG